MNKMKQIWNFRIMFFSSAFACLGVLMTLWEIAGFFCELDKLEYGKRISIVVGLFILVVSFLYAYCKLFCKKKTLELKINIRTKLYVQKENLMAVDGVKVIPVNEYFDTHNGVVSSILLHFMVSSCLCLMIELTI